MLSNRLALYVYSKVRNKRNETIQETSHLGTYGRLGKVIFLRLGPRGDAYAPIWAVTVVSIITFFRVPVWVRPTNGQGPLLTRIGRSAACESGRADLGQHATGETDQGCHV